MAIEEYNLKEEINMGEVLKDIMRRVGADAWKNMLLVERHDALMEEFYKRKNRLIKEKETQERICNLEANKKGLETIVGCLFSLTIMTIISTIGIGYYFYHNYYEKPKTESKPVITETIPSYKLN